MVPLFGHHKKCNILKVKKGRFLVLFGFYRAMHTDLRKLYYVSNMQLATANL